MNFLQTAQKEDWKVIDMWQSDGFKVVLWDTGKTGPYGKRQIAYKVWDKGFSNYVLFTGVDLFVPHVNRALVDLLSFLSVGFDDTDPEYFESYKPRQLAWMETDRREELSFITFDMEETIYKT